MKKSLFLSALSLLQLGFSAVCTFFLCKITYSSGWTPFLIGVAFLLAGVLLAKFGMDGYKLSLSIVAYILNAIALGFFICAWCVVFERAVGLPALLFAALMASATLLVCNLFENLFRWGSIVGLLVAAIPVLLLVLGLGKIFRWESFLLSIVGLYLVVSLSYLFARANGGDDYADQFQSVAFMSFGLGAVAVIVCVALLLSGGDGCDSCSCDGCSCDGGGSGNSTRHINKRLKPTDSQQTFRSFQNGIIAATPAENQGAEKRKTPTSVNPFAEMDALRAEGTASNPHVSGTAGAETKEAQGSSGNGANGINGGANGSGGNGK